MLVGADLPQGDPAPLTLNGRSLDLFTSSDIWAWILLILGICLFLLFRIFYHFIEPRILWYMAGWGSKIRYWWNYCIPIVSILSYACAVKQYSSSEMHDCNVAINNAIWKIYSFGYNESVRHLREDCGLGSIYEIFHIARSKFHDSAFTSSNDIVCYLSNCDLD